jgi:RNA polymerase sigma-70 factor, ECF subfamily
MALYDRALPQVYGYLADRCRDPATAEDLTSETFLAAVRAAKAPGTEPPSVAWLVAVARHKLVDHWRRQSRQERLVDRVAGAAASGPAGDDPWDAQVDRLRAEDVLSRLGPHHRAALTLRYVDALPVPEVAELLGRTVHATEALLVRARAAYRKLDETDETDATDATDATGGDDG